MFSLEKVINSKLNGLEYSVILDSGVTKLGGLVTSINFATPFSPRKMRSVEYMSEVFICRGSSGGTSGGKPYPGAEKVLQTYLITESQDWVVPNNIINNELFVRIAGGGGGYNANFEYCMGGGGGWMNNGTVKVGSGSIIPIIIGKGGGHLQDGGSTSFGTYLSSNGGTSGYTSGGSGGSGGGGYSGGRGFQFGGGGRNCDSKGNRGGNGGVWGGGGAPNGTGGYYGGGGGGIYETTHRGERYDIVANGGNGGYYGGGGGGVYGGIGGWYNDNGTWKQSGFGGNGGNYTVNAENGTNTIGWTNTFINNLNNNYATGNGIAGNAKTFTSSGYGNSSNMCFGGGGGFGGNGGWGSFTNWRQVFAESFGGGGGYGSNGGNAHVYDDIHYKNYSGGGGGYGGDGGDGSRIYINNGMGMFFYGGGGGYCSKGNFGGGGYYSPGGIGGGGVYLFNNSFGDGGYRRTVPYSGSETNVNGRDGGCLIQFYQWL